MRWRWPIGGLGALATGMLALGLLDARAPPVVRRATIGIDHWPAGARPVTVALLSDIHIGNPAMNRARLDRIVAQVNSLHPDLVLLAGDYVAGADPGATPDRAAQLAAALGGLRAPLGVVAVLGNHDNWSAPRILAASLRRAGITVLENQPVTRGPLAIGGAGDAYSHHDRMPRLLAALARLSGAPLILTHSPDVAPAAGPVRLVLAGHTHCGQIHLPPLPMPPISRYGDRYRCGIIREGARTTIVTAGVGASSHLPIRFNAPPDLWLVTLGPAR